LGEGDTLDGEELLGVDGLVDGDGVLAEAGDLVEIFEADDGEGGGGESVFAGVLGGADLPSGERGPVDWAALARLAASCLSEMGFLGFVMGVSSDLSYSKGGGAVRNTNGPSCGRGRG
jgi:hypothetical protein